MKQIEAQRQAFARTLPGFNLLRQQAAAIGLQTPHQGGEGGLIQLRQIDLDDVRNRQQGLVAVAARGRIVQRQTETAPLQGATARHDLVVDHHRFEQFQDDAIGRQGIDVVAEQHLGIDVDEPAHSPRTISMPICLKA